MTNPIGKKDIPGVFWNMPKPPSDIEDKELYRACLGFEAYFARYLTKSMRGSTSMIAGNNAGAHIYQGMLDEAFADQMTGRRGLGLADLLYKQIHEKNGIDPLHVPSPARHSENSTDQESREKLSRYDSIIDRAAEKNMLDPDLIRAVILQESDGNSRAVSPAGAKGLMQLMDDTADYLGVTNIFNPVENIEGGSKYLKEQLDQFEDLELALAAYNAGPEHVRKHQGIPPFRETEDYVKKVLGRYSSLKRTEHLATITPIPSEGNHDE